MRFENVCRAISTLCKDIADAKKFDDDKALTHDLSMLRHIVKVLSEDVRREREDSAFFEKELEDVEEPKETPGAHVTEEEKEDSCDAVAAFRERRKKRSDSACVDRFKKRRQDRLDAKDDGKEKRIL